MIINSKKITNPETDIRSPLRNPDDQVSLLVWPCVGSTFLWRLVFFNWENPSLNQVTQELCYLFPRPVVRWRGGLGIGWHWNLFLSTYIAGCPPDGTMRVLELAPKGLEKCSQQLINFQLWENNPLLKLNMLKGLSLLKFQRTMS